MKKLNHLPDDCMLELFHRIPLHSRIHCTQLVCHRWRHLHLTTCRYRTTTLALFEPSDFPFFSPNHWTLCHRNDHLVLRQKLTFELCTTLADQFPNTSRLDLVQIICTEQIYKTIRLLDALSGRLVSLKLYFFSKDYARLYQEEEVEDNTPVYQLLEQVAHRGKLPGLRSLTLYIDLSTDNIPLYHSDTTLFDLSKLERLHIICMPENVQRLLLQGNGNNDISYTSLRRLTFDCMMVDDLDDGYTILQHFARCHFRQLTHLTMYNLFSDTSVICEIIQRYCQQLTHLRLRSVEMQPLVSICSKLSQQFLSASLQYLCLDFCRREDYLQIFWAWKPEIPIFWFPSVCTLILRTPSGNLLSSSALLPQATLVLSTTFPAVTSLTTSYVSYNVQELRASGFLIREY